MIYYMMNRFLCEHFKMPNERRAKIALKDINTVTKELTSVLSYDNQKDPLVVFFIENCEKKLEILWEDKRLKVDYVSRQIS